MHAPSYTHLPVLLKEAVESLVGRPDGVYIDGTFGRGGHSQAILERLDAHGQLVAFDKDPRACAIGQTLSDPRFHMVHGSFTGLARALTITGVSQVSGILLDLGVSSPQLDDASRGFSFQQDGPLDMRMDTSSGYSASEWLAQVQQEELAQVIQAYSDERFAKQIAKVIVERQAQCDVLGPLNRTRELAELVARTVRTREPGKHPATRTFQAIRLHINQELQELRTALEQAIQILEPGGRLAVISFHSLEDRIVKHFLQKQAGLGNRLEEQDQKTPPHKQRALLRKLPMRLQEEEKPAPLMTILGRIRASEAEISANPRARSAILRVAQKIEC